MLVVFENATCTSGLPVASVPDESVKSPLTVCPAIVAVSPVATTENAEVAVSIETLTVCALTLIPGAAIVSEPLSAAEASLLDSDTLPVNPVALTRPPPMVSDPFASASDTLGVPPVVTTTVTSAVSVWPSTVSVAPVARTLTYGPVPAGSDSASVCPPTVYVWLTLVPLELIWTVNTPVAAMPGTASARLPVSDAASPFR